MSSKNAPERPAASWSLAARLTAWYVGSAFLLILLATGFLYWALVTNLDREDDQLLRDKIHVLGTILGEEVGATTALEREVERETGAGRRVPVFLRVLDREGRLVLETPGMSDRLPRELFPDPDAGPGREVETPTGQAYRVLAARITADAGPASGYLVQAALDRTYEEDLLSGYRRDLGIVLGITLALCALAGYQIVRRCLKPVHAIAERVQGIQPTTLNERLPVAGLPAELSVLAVRFNAMLDRLEDSFSRLARFSADIAHELRTPVNNLRGEVEVALGKPRSLDEYREVLGSALEECGRLARIIDSLLFLARSESPQARVVGESLDVGAELATVREFYEAAAAEKGVTLRVAAGAGIVAALDRTLLQRAVGNLVANALDHTPAGGVITLAARTTGQEVALEVADTGCGIPPEHLPHIFDRFYRVDQARTNASGRVGLGLAIVQSIAALHRGTVSIASQPQQGTRVTLVFPLAPAKMTIL